MVEAKNEFGLNRDVLTGKLMIELKKYQIMLCVVI